MPTPQKASPAGSATLLAPPQTPSTPRRKPQATLDLSPVPAAPEPAPKRARPAARPKAETPTLNHEAIAARAYEIFVARGRVHGHDQEDWQQAERELREAGDL